VSIVSSVGPSEGNFSHEYKVFFYLEQEKYTRISRQIFRHEDVIFFRGPNATREERMDALYTDSVAFGVSCATLSAIQFILAVVTIDLLNMAASRQIARVRKMFLKAVLRQDMAWYDTNTSTNFASRITE
jgi:hypothetical protein